MEMWFVIAALFVLFVLIIGYFIIAQIKEKENAKIQQERKRSYSIVNSTEELLSQSAYVPFSLNLLFILNNRIVKELENLQRIDIKNKELKSRIESKKSSLEKLMSENYTMTNFRVPDSDKQAIAVLKLVKRLKDIVRTEHNKGHVETAKFSEETKRLDTLKVTINIENAVNRIKISTIKGDYGTAAQLAHKSLEMLHSNPTDDFLESKREFLEETLKEINLHKEKEKNAHIERSVEKPNDLDVIFGEKKKW